MPASQRLPSANSGEPTGAITPADALGESKRMSQSDGDAKESTECPTCGRTDFASARGMRCHHKRTHDKSLKWVVVECVWCGSDTKAQHQNVAENERTFCDNTCKGNWQSENWTGEKSSLWDGGSKDLSCANCGAQVKVRPSLSEKYNRHFCDRACKTEWQRENQHEVDGWGYSSGADHRDWEGGQQRYGKGWNDKKKRTVRERDGFVCQACGLSNDAHQEEYGRALDVHHVRPAREFDSAERRNDPDNLITLCIPCHQEWEGIPLQPQTD